MKNNILGAMVIFFAVVACLLIIDDLSYKPEASLTIPTEKQLSEAQQTEHIATTDLEDED